MWSLHPGESYVPSDLLCLKKEKCRHGPDCFGTQVMAGFLLRILVLGEIGSKFWSAGLSELCFINGWKRLSPWLLRPLREAGNRCQTTYQSLVPGTLWVVSVACFQLSEDPSTRSPIPSSVLWILVLVAFTDLHQVHRMFHFSLQVVWATSYKVGCAVHFCHRIHNLHGFNNVAHFVCDYGPA